MENQLTNLALTLREKDKEYNNLDAENDDLVDGCNEIIQKYNKRLELVEYLQDERRALEEENENLKKQLMSKKRKATEDQFKSP